MKLFQRLLVAPAALGLIAPVVANANEVNLNEIAKYYDSESFEFYIYLFIFDMFISCCLYLGA